MRFLLIPVIVVLWCAGGQGYLWARRFGVPIISYLYAAVVRPDWQCLVLTLSCTALIMGYGESSWLKKYEVKSETWTRVWMAVVISSVFAMYERFTDYQLAKIAVVFILNLAAWQVCAGALRWHPWGKDIIIPDIFRALAFGVSLVLTCP